MDMSLIKSQGNKSTELKLREALDRSGLDGYQVCVSRLPGKPDIVFKDRLAMFADGCFWHGCHAHYRAPRTNKAFWTKKIKANRARDLKNAARLSALGYKVIRVWEHDLSDLRSLKPILTLAARALGVGRRPEIEPYIDRAVYSVPSNVMWCGPCFGAMIHDIKDLTGFGVYVEARCNSCGARSRRVNGISIGKDGINGADIH